MSYDNPKPPLTADTAYRWARVVDGDIQVMAEWLITAFPDWEARQAAAIAELTDRFTPKLRWTWKRDETRAVATILCRGVYWAGLTITDAHAQALCDAWNALEAGA